jgi:hypothetical protein
MPEKPTGLADSTSHSRVPRRRPSNLKPVSDGGRPSSTASAGSTHVRLLPVSICTRTSRAPTAPRTTSSSGSASHATRSRSSSPGPRAGSGVSFQASHPRPQSSVKRPVRKYSGPIHPSISTPARSHARTPLHARPSASKRATSKMRASPAGDPSASDERHALDDVQAQALDHARREREAGRVRGVDRERDLVAIDLRAEVRVAEASDVDAVQLRGIVRARLRPGRRPARASAAGRDRGCRGCRQRPRGAAARGRHADSMA